MSPARSIRAILRNFALALVFVILPFLISTTKSASACRPRSDYKYPTLEENFKRAKAVFVGRIASAKPSGKKQLLTIEITKAWKTPTPDLKLATVMTEETSSCDRLGYSVEPGNVCLIFLTQNDVIVSHLLAGEASLCIPANTPRANTLVSEFDEKFKKFVR